MLVLRVLSNCSLWQMPIHVPCLVRQVIIVHLASSVKLMMSYCNTKVWLDLLILHLVFVIAIAAINQWALVKAWASNKLFKIAKRKLNRHHVERSHIQKPSKEYLLVNQLVLQKKQSTGKSEISLTTENGVTELSLQLQAQAKLKN